MSYSARKGAEICTDLHCLKSVSRC